MTTTRTRVQHHDTSPTSQPNEHSHQQSDDLHSDLHHDHQHEQNHQHITTNDTTTNDHNQDNYKDPQTEQTEHTQASGSPGDLREPWRAAQAINYEINSGGEHIAPAERGSHLDREDPSC